MCNVELSFIMFILVPIDILNSLYTNKYRRKIRKRFAGTTKWFDLWNNKACIVVKSTGYNTQILFYLIIYLVPVQNLHRDHKLQNSLRNCADCSSLFCFRILLTSHCNWQSVSDQERFTVRVCEKYKVRENIQPK